MQRIGDLEIDEDAAFAERGWRFQQVGWLLMLLFAAGALLGLTGSGPLSSATAAADHFRLKYDRFDRTTTLSPLTFQFDPAVVRDGTIRVWLKRDYLDSFVIESVAPEPESVASAADRLIYTFRVMENHPGEITFHLKADPRAFGLVQGEAGVISQGQINFRQLLYP
jgi:hypothetical protein